MIFILKIISILLLLAPAASAEAQVIGSGSQQAPPAPAATNGPIAEVVVIGSRAKAESLAGAGTYLDRAELRLHAYDDINRALRRVPGVYLREEDGYGLFPNLSLRGVDTTRSAKLTIMEDGVPTAPATYSAPAAYYTPTTGRMSAIEILKGSSQIRWGPHTTGGVINYRSTPVPEGFHGQFRASFGTNDEFRQHAWVGNSFGTALGRVGYLVEYYFRHSDGFKRIDATASLADSGETGFRRSEPMLKLFLEPRGERYSRLELKIGGTDLDADETYLGLSDGDFSSDHDRRYAASRFDHVDTNHFRSYLRYTRELSDSTTLIATGYYNTFRRNWFKLRGNGADLARNLENGCWLGRPDDPEGCDLPYRNNRRDYYVAGGELVLDLATSLGETDHRVEIGVRYQQDRVERDQDNFRFRQLPDGSIDLTRSGTLGKCSGGCRWQQARALSLFLQDRIEAGRLTLQPGIRLERIGNRWRDEKKETQEDRDILTAWSGGVGAHWALTDSTGLFAGIHRGVSVPSPRDHVDKGLREETSLAYELGLRLAPAAFLTAEISLFYTDFDDLLVVESIGSGNLRSENVGDVNAYGLELSADFDLGAWAELGFANPWHLALTLTEAQLDGSAQSADLESIFSGGKDENDVPYIPNYQLQVGTGLEFERFSLYLDASWVDEAYTTASNTSRPINRAGELDYNLGKTDRHVVVDASARFNFSESVALTLNVYNLLDERYIVSRHPIGPRPGRPFSALLGAEIAF